MAKKKATAAATESTTEAPAPTKPAAPKKPPRPQAPELGPISNRNAVDCATSLADIIKSGELNNNRATGVLLCARIIAGLSCEYRSEPDPYTEPVHEDDSVLSVAASYAVKEAHAFNQNLTPTARYRFARLVEATLKKVLKLSKAR